MATRKDPYLEEFLRAVRCAVNGATPLIRDDPPEVWLARIKKAAERMQADDPLAWAVGMASHAYLAASAMQP